MWTGEELKEVAKRLSCKKLPDAKKALQEVLEQKQFHSGEGFTVRIVERLGPQNARGCCDAPFAVIERSGGGRGLTKWYEIELSCPLLIAEHRIILPKENELEDKLPPSLVDVKPVSIALEAMLKGQAALSYQADMRARVAWDGLDDFEVIEPIAQALEPGRRYTKRRNCALFYQYLLRFEEDSAENILGRIWETVHHLDLLHRPHPQEILSKNQAQVNDLLFELGGLVERLKWKPALEIAAEHGEKFDAKKHPRTANATQANKIDRKLRHDVVFKVVETFDRKDFEFRSSGNLNCTALAKAVVESDPFKSTKTGMKEGAVANLLRQQSSRLRFKPKKSNNTS